MTALSTHTTPDDQPSPDDQPTASARRHDVAVTSHYTVRSIVLSFRNLGFVVFTVALPVMMYLLFGQLFGGGDVNVQGYIMVSMAAYGAIGAALNSGAQIQIERRTGWFRQLMLTGLTPGGFVVGKVVTALALVLPAIVLVFVVAAVVGGVRLSATVWLGSGVAIWVSVIVMVLLGLVLGLWFKAETVNALTTILLLGMAALGGLWLPVDMMPAWLQSVAHTLPTYWIGEFGRWPVLGGAFPVRGLLVLGAWLVGLGVLGLIGYRRAVATSSR